MVKTIAIVTPVLDDWASFAELTTEISDRFTGSDVVFHIYAVDDGSAAPFDAADVVLPTMAPRAAIIAKVSAGWKPSGDERGARDSG